MPRRAGAPIDPAAARAAAKARRELKKACNEYRALAVQEAAIAERKKALMAQIDTGATAAGVTTLPGPGWLLCRGRWSRAELRPELLLEQGVSKEAIAAATVRRSKEYWQVLGQPLHQVDAVVNREAAGHG